MWSILFRINHISGMWSIRLLDDLIMITPKVLTFHIYFSNIKCNEIVVNKEYQHKFFAVFHLIIKCVNV